MTVLSVLQTPVKSLQNGAGASGEKIEQTWFAEKKMGVSAP